MLTTARAALPPLVAAPRWGVVAGLAVALIALGQLAFAAGDAPPTLGLRAEENDGRVVLSWVRPAGIAWAAGFRPGDVVINVDGRVAIATDAQAIAAAQRVDARLASGATVTAATRAADATAGRRQGTFPLLAAWFALVGAATFVLARDLRAALSLLVGTAGAAAALLAALATPYGAGWALTIVFVGLNSFGAGTLLFFLRFPIDRAATRAGRTAIVGCIVIHLTLIIAYPAVVTAVPGTYRWLQLGWFAALLGDLLGASALAIAAWWAVPLARAEARSALALAALGLVSGAMPFCLLTLLPPLAGLPRPVPPDVAALSLGLLPAGLALALLSRQFLGITRLVRRGLVAAVVWLGLLVVCAIALDALRQGLAARQAPLALALGSTLTTGALFAGAFPPAQAALRRALERRLFRDTYDPAATLRQFGAALAGLPSGDLDALAREILGRLAATLDLAWCALALREPESAARTWTRGAFPRGLAPIDFLPADASAVASMRATDDGRAVIVPLIGDGVPIGALALGPKAHDIELLPDDIAFVATLTPLAATALQSVTRGRQLAARVAALAAREATLAALSARLLRAQEEERRRIALEIHDDPLQRATLLARALDNPPDERVPPGARPALMEIIGALRAICAGLHPPVLDELGLVAALEWLAEDARARAEDDLTVEVRADTEVAARRLDPGLEAALFRVAQEALNNVLKHARASHVEIVLACYSGEVRLSVLDDGRGYGATVGVASGPSSLRLGLAGMRERLRPWVGSVTVGARPGGGTAVEASVPHGGSNG